MVAITGQVASPLIGTDAFQEVDIFGITLPIDETQFHLIRDTADIPRVFAEAFQLARTGRPGPVLIDLPKDVGLRASVPAPFTLKPEPEIPSRPEEAAICAANALIAEASAPVIYFGGGIAIARAEQPLRAFTKRSGIPAVATLKGLPAAIPTEEHNFLGMLGMHGSRAANVAIDNCRPSHLHRRTVR